MKKQYLLIAIFALAVQFANAQFSLEGEFRPRTELKGNGVSSTALEDSKPWVQTTVRAALMSKYRSLKLGRQPLSYDDQRILGGLGWAQQARTHDVGILKLKDEGFSFDAGLAINTDGDNIYDTAALFSYKQLAFLHANKKFGKVSVSGLVLNNIYQAATTNKSSLWTAGVHLKGKFNKLGLAANAYIQSGDRVGDVEVSGANLLSLDATYAISDKATILAGIESISGTQDDSAAFFPLYGTNHKFNGFMDRFYVGNYANANGLVDMNIGAKFKLGSGYNFSIKAHNFNEQSNTQNNLGQELDLVLAKGFKGFKLVAGYSQFFESDDYAAANSESFQNWAWAMLIIKPKFFSTGKKMKK